MYGVNFPNEDIDYAAEAAKKNVAILGERCEELKRENAELRECLKKLVAYFEQIGIDYKIPDLIVKAKATLEGENNEND